MQKVNEGNNKFKLYNLIAAALLTAVSAALAPLNVYIPLLGVSSPLRFSVTEIPVFLCGALFGPVLGLISGFLSDILGYFIAPAGPYFFGFTISRMAVGFIPGIIFYGLKGKENFNGRSIKRLNIGLAIAALMGALFYINVLAIKDVRKLGNIAGISMNMILSGVMVFIVLLLMLIVKKIGKALEGREGIYRLQTIVMAVSLNYIMVSLILSPIWVHALYNVPIAASVIARIFKSLIDVPLQVTVCYGVLQAIPIKLRQKIAC